MSGGNTLFIHWFIYTVRDRTIGAYYTGGTPRFADNTMKGNKY